MGAHTAIYAIARKFLHDAGELAKTSGLTLSFKKSKNVAFAHRTFHIPNKRTASKFRSSFIHELHSHLNDTTTRSSAPQNLLDFGKFWGIRVHLETDDVSQLP